MKNPSYTATVEEEVGRAAGDETPAWRFVRLFEGATAKNDAHTFARARTSSQKIRHRVVISQVVAIFKPRSTK